MGLMFASICWMLQGWISENYAIFTTLLAILGWGLSGPWINSYWGGAVAATGGALVTGAIPRTIRGPALTSTLLGSLGLVLLANSRPFEGLLTAVGGIAVVVWRLGRQKQQWKRMLNPRTLATFLLIIILAAVGMGYYNYRTTGNVLLLPYTVNQRMYTASPFFWIFSPIPTPVYRHENIRRYWVDWVLPYYAEARARPELAVRRSGAVMARFFLMSPFVLAVLAGLLLTWSREVRFALAILAVPIFGLMFTATALPHYLAPAFGAFLLIGGVGLQKAGKWQSFGPVVIAGFIGVSAAWCASAVQVETRQARQASTGIARRPAVVNQLHRAGGMHLVIVRYGEYHNFHEEWVYNRANIDASEIVWAQDMGEARNRELLNYFRGRKVWLLQPDTDPLTLTAYTPPLISN